MLAKNNKRNKQAQLKINKSTLNMEQKRRNLTARNAMRNKQREFESREYNTRLEQSSERSRTNFETQQQRREQNERRRQQIKNAKAARRAARIESGEPEEIPMWQKAAGGVSIIINGYWCNDINT